MAPTKSSAGGAPSDPVNLTTSAKRGVAHGRIVKKRDIKPPGPSCLSCRKAKARCDRVMACERCIRANEECFSAGASAVTGDAVAGGKAPRACERCKRMKAACVRKESCARCKQKQIECVMG
ncbi:hypothetical protein C7999DRAFT_15663 [Corynascus novoguineensis]|uniref:Zn(2)-C6 fungal-type domain-containing protein n=1 Tax=Corynascus novoguineensis TaxID=1126955 RepID=A0AAN7HLY6_9PEZI|nr:hypothetical protein C7999DRAFT_15663 [Corynascus novoguineensis]